MKRDIHDLTRRGRPFHLPHKPKPKPPLGNEVCPSCGAWCRALQTTSGWCSQCTHRFYLKDCV